MELQKNKAPKTKVEKLFLNVPV